MGAPSIHLFHQKGCRLPPNLATRSTYDAYDCPLKNLTARTLPPLSEFSSRKGNLTKANPYRKPIDKV